MGLARIELATSALSVLRSNRLSYSPADRSTRLHHRRGIQISEGLDAAERGQHIRRPIRADYCLRLLGLSRMVRLATEDAAEASVLGARNGELWCRSEVSPRPNQIIPSPLDAPELPVWPGKWR